MRVSRWARAHRTAVRWADRTFQLEALRARQAGPAARTGHAPVHDRLGLTLHRRREPRVLRGWQTRVGEAVEGAVSRVRRTLNAWRAP